MIRRSRLTAALDLLPWRAPAPDAARCLAREVAAAPESRASSRPTAAVVSSRLVSGPPSIRGRPRRARVRRETGPPPPSSSRPHPLPPRDRLRSRRRNRWTGAVISRPAPPAVSGAPHRTPPRRPRACSRAPARPFWRPRRGGGNGRVMTRLGRRPFADPPRSMSRSRARHPRRRPPPTTSSVDRPRARHRGTADARTRASTSRSRRVTRRSPISPAPPRARRPTRNRSRDHPPRPRFVRRSPSPTAQPGTSWCSRWRQGRPRQAARPLVRSACAVEQRPSPTVPRVARRRATASSAHRPRLPSPLRLLRADDVPPRPSRRPRPRPGSGGFGLRGRPPPATRAPPRRRWVPARSRRRPRPTSRPCRINVGRRPALPLRGVVGRSRDRPGARPHGRPRGS